MSIKEKLATHLSKEITSEADCVYLLSLIRKYLEEFNVKGFWNLRMCANWALHSALDNQKNETVRVFLEEVNEFLVQAESHGKYDLESYGSLKDKLLFFTAFHVELKSLLESINIDVEILHDSNQLAQLIKKFERIVEDSPLICKANKHLSHLSEISLSRRKSIMPKDNWPSSFYWTIKRNDNTQLYLKLENKKITYSCFEMEIQAIVIIENKS